MDIRHAISVQNALRTSRGMLGFLVVSVVAYLATQVEGGSFTCPPSGTGRPCWIVYTRECSLSQGGSAFTGCDQVQQRVCASSTTWSLANIQVFNIQQYAGCPQSLTSIDLQGNNISTSRQGGHTLLENLTRLISLQLSYNHLTELGMSWLGGLTSLQSLNASNNFISSLESSAFASLGQLEILDLSHNQLVGSLDPSLLSSLTRLRSLYLQHNSLTSIPLDSIQSLVLSSSGVLDIAYNKIETLDASLLKSAKIRLAGNPLVCNFSLCQLGSAGNINNLLDTGNTLCTSPSSVARAQVTEVFKRLQCGSQPCNAHQCEAYMHPAHATCSGGVCSCNSPLYVSNGLHCACSAVARLTYIKFCNESFGTTCLLDYSCEDRNECLENTAQCGNQKCQNTIGSYVCVDQTGGVAPPALVTSPTPPPCEPACLRYADCVRRGNFPPRCECRPGFTGRAHSCTLVGNETFDHHPTPFPPTSNNSMLILIVAVVGGVAGLVALLYVFIHCIRKCRQRRPKKHQLTRATSQRSTAGIMQQNEEYEKNSLDGSGRSDRFRAFGMFSTRRRESPIYASAEQITKMPKFALSPLYESNKAKDADGYALPRNVIIQEDRRTASLDSHGRRLPPPISITRNTAVMPNMERRDTGPRPGAMHPYVVLNAVSGEVFTPASPAGHVTFSEFHQYHSPRDSVVTGTSSVSESDLDNLVVHRDPSDSSVQQVDGRPVAMIRPYEQACINPHRPNELIHSTSQGALRVRAASEGHLGKAVAVEPAAMNLTARYNTPRLQEQNQNNKSPVHQNLTARYNTPRPQEQHQNNKSPVHQSIKEDVILKPLPENSSRCNSVPTPGDE